MQIGSVKCRRPIRLRYLCDRCDNWQASNGTPPFALFRGRWGRSALRASGRAPRYRSARTVAADPGPGEGAWIYAVRPVAARSETQCGREVVLDRCTTDSARSRGGEAFVPSGWLPAKPGLCDVGFVEVLSWHGVVPDSFRRFRRRQPDAELELHPLLSNQQMEAVRSGKLDAGFIFSLEEPDGDIAQLPVARHKLMLAAPQGHAVTRLQATPAARPLRCALCLVSSVGESRLSTTASCEGMRSRRFESPRIVQHVVDHATTLSLVSCRLGVAFVSETARWQCPRGVTLLPVADLDYPSTVLSDLAERRSVGAVAEICGTGKSLCVAKAVESLIPVRKPHGQTRCRPTACRRRVLSSWDRISLCPRVSLTHQRVRQVRKPLFFGIWAAADFGDI